MNEMIEQIKSLLETARQKVAAEVNSTLIMTYWQIGKIIVEDEQKHESRAEYGKQTLKTLSKFLPPSTAKVFPSQIFNLCGGFSSHTKNNRQCLLNCLGRIIANYCSFRTNKNAVFTRRNA